MRLNTTKEFRRLQKSGERGLSMNLDSKLNKSAFSFYLVDQKIINC